MEAAKTRSSSPTPQVDKSGLGELSFYDAIKEVVEGEKITKVEWETNEEYVFMRAETLHIHKDGKDHVWTVREPDIIGVDWVVLA
jgi:hypothetical protein